jgi:hypothetical protein
LVIKCDDRPLKVLRGGAALNPERDRTQEVAGPSPASSISERFCKWRYFQRITIAGAKTIYAFGITIGHQIGAPIRNPAVLQK